jgi:alanine racemase
MTLTWCEVSREALRHNVASLRRRVGPGPLLAPTVKGNAYGHGLVLASRCFLEAGADWLCVNALYEARALRAAGITAPLYVVGYVARDELEEALALDCDLVLYDEAIFRAAVVLAERLGRPARFHLKLETGNHRQGLGPAEAMALAKEVARHPWARLRGLSSHYANVEDTTDHSYAQQQFDKFQRFAQALRAEGLGGFLSHLSNSAASILWPSRCLDMVRTGIAAYGMWPSTETRVAALLAQDGAGELELRPALTWVCKVAQVKEVGAGEYVGYGCTYRTTHPTKLAILPVGYYDGYDRGLSNLAHVLIGGVRAPVRGRVCMNILMVDVTDVPGVRAEQEAILLGAAREGGERISAEQLGQWAGTINYEVTTRIREEIPRVLVG